MPKTQAYIINCEASVREALEMLNHAPAQTLFIINNKEQVVGTLTDGDIRRGLLQGISLNDKAISLCLKSFHYLNATNTSVEHLRELKKKLIKVVPYLSPEGKILKVIDLQNTYSLLPIDAVIMAGGRGERLRPLTDTTPKPLLPLGDKPIVEYNIDRIIQYGIENIIFSIRYLGEQIRAHFGNGKEKGICISYIEEEKPLGTIGAVSKINHFENETILIMNSDLFTNIDLEEFYLHFIHSNADMAVASIPYNVGIPYAVMKTEKELITSFEEKPTYTFYSNAGIYLVKRSILEKMPQDTYCDATDLMQQLISKGKRVTYFPIVGYWIDIGKPEDYKKAQEFIKFLKKD